MPLPNYPAPPGNKQSAIHKVTGPASYATVVTGATPTGGQVVKATDMGMVAIEAVYGGASDDGQYYVVPIYPSNPNKEVASVILMWIVANTGAQVTATTNLSGRTVRLHATGL